MKKLFVIFPLIVLFLGACAAQAQPTASATPTQGGAEIANPASQNCIKQGGTLTIQTRGDGGQYGICTFEDNRQCEEWALMRGNCPAGGLKITGYNSPAAQYCVITGGSYTSTDSSNPDHEQGTCSLPGGVTCDAWDYYNGKCDASTQATPTPTAQAGIQPFPMELCDGLAQALSHTLDDRIPTQSEQPISDPVNNLQGTGCMSTITGTGLDFKNPIAVVDRIEAQLKGENFVADPMLIADGPTGTARGYRQGKQICWASADWSPDETANCPKDQPISACTVTPKQQNFIVTLNCGMESK